MHPMWDTDQPPPPTHTTITTPHSLANPYGSRIINSTVSNTSPQPASQRSAYPSPHISLSLPLWQSEGSSPNPLLGRSCVCVCVWSQ